MKKTFLLFTFVAIATFLHAQSLSDEIAAALTEDSAKSTSELDITLSAGNGTFSKNSKAKNTAQETFSKILYNAGLTYHHKSGAGISLTAFSLVDNGLKIYQYAINPFYYYSDDNIYAGGGYTYYVRGETTSIGKNPYQNEFSGEFKWVKPAVRPSLTIDYSGGKSNESIDTVFTVNVPAPPHPVHYTDNIHSVVKDLTVSLSADHLFLFKRIFTGADELSMEPALALNAGSGSIKNTHSGNIVLPKRLKQAFQNIRGLTAGNKQKFELESVSLSGDIYYSIGKFFAEPQIYIDYYLPATDTKRLSTIFSIGAGISF